MTSDRIFLTLRLRSKAYTIKPGTGTILGSIANAYAYQHCLFAQCVCGMRYALQMTADRQTDGDGNGDDDDITLRGIIREVLMLWFSIVVR